eukprot:scaffold5110_cov69-Cyclotella_meneghiniana.AAC.4
MPVVSQSPGASRKVASFCAWACRRGQAGVGHTAHYHTTPRADNSPNLRRTVASCIPVARREKSDNYDWQAWTVMRQVVMGLGAARPLSCMKLTASNDLDHKVTCLRFDETFAMFDQFIFLCSIIVTDPPESDDGLFNVGLLTGAVYPVSAHVLESELLVKTRQRASLSLDRLLMALLFSMPDDSTMDLNSFFKNEGANDGGCHFPVC